MRMQRSKGHQILTGIPNFTCMLFFGEVGMLCSHFCALSLLLAVSCVAADTRYLLYSVNAGEGFNLRRDVHMRAATLVRLLRERDGSDWVLVLPPWPRLFHWRSSSNKAFEPWSKFFDLASLNEYVPSIEFDDYLEHNGHVINEVMVLQQDFEGGWSADNFGKIEEKPCLEQSRYRHVREGQWEGKVFGRSDLTIQSHRCLSAMGSVSLIIPPLQQSTSISSSILVEHFEDLLHERFGDRDYWHSRYSMVYAAHLREAGATFMRERLGYDPGEGGRGREEVRQGGGDYLAVHLRRRDYLHAHAGTVPSLEGAASQLNTLKKELKLKAVFLASDAPFDEKKALQKMVKGLVWYTPTNTELRNYGDGGVAIIDQWIAAHAKHFVGTAYSTFSFRIREDRQFLGFSKDSTFNDLCGPSKAEHDPHSCDKPTYWKINFEGEPPQFSPDSPKTSTAGSAKTDRNEL